MVSQNQPVNIVPQHDGDGCTYQIQGGSLPIGLTLSSSTGVISGSAHDTHSPYVVSIKSYNVWGSCQTKRPPLFAMSLS